MKATTLFITSISSTLQSIFFFIDQLIFFQQVWAALGTAIVSVAGVIFFGEHFDIAKVLCVSMIVLGVIGLNVIEEH